jgi:hypothetical protein
MTMRSSKPSVYGDERPVTNPRDIVPYLSHEERKSLLRGGYTLLAGESSLDASVERADEESPPKEGPQARGIPACAWECFGGILLGDNSPEEEYRIARKAGRYVTPKLVSHDKEEAVLLWATPQLLVNERVEALAKAYAAGEPLWADGEVDPQDGGVGVPEDKLPHCEGISTVNTSSRRYSRDGALPCEEYVAEKGERTSLVGKQRADGMKRTPQRRGIVVGRKLAKAAPPMVAVADAGTPTPVSKEQMKKHILTMLQAKLITVEEAAKYL